MTSMPWVPSAPSFMMEPFPNCFSIWRMAASMALVFSLNFLDPSDDNGTDLPGTATARTSLCAWV